jgi:hypothetical protein
MKEENDMNRKHGKTVASNFLKNVLQQTLVIDEITKLMQTLTDTKRTQVDCKEIFSNFFNSFLFKCTVGKNSRHQQDFFELFRSYFLLKSQWFKGYTTFGCVFLRFV